MKFFFIVLLVFMPVYLISAQEEDTTYKYWMTLGVGAINTTLNFNYSFSIADNFYKVNYLKRGGLFTRTGRDGYLYNSFDISIGKRLQSKWFQGSLFTGPSYILGEKKITPGNNEKFNTIGLETDLQLLFRLANEVGIGIGLYGNLNFEKNYSGININLTLGNGK